MLTADMMTSNFNEVDYYYNKNNWEEQKEKIKRAKEIMSMMLDKVASLEEQGVFKVNYILDTPNYYDLGEIFCMGAPEQFELYRKKVANINVQKINQALNQTIPAEMLNVQELAYYMVVKKMEWNGNKVKLVRRIKYHPIAAAPRYKRFVIEPWILWSKEKEKKE